MYCVLNMGSPLSEVPLYDDDTRITTNDSPLAIAVSHF